MSKIYEDKKIEETISPLICPVCCRYGGFDGKNCKYCGAKKYYKKFVVEKTPNSTNVDKLKKD